MFGYWGYGYSPLGGIVGGVLMIVFWIFIIWLIVAIIRRISGGGRQWRHWDSEWRSRGDKDALDILKERYARGEIDKTEFDQKRKDLGI